MQNSQLDTSLVDKAIHFAVRAHAGTERRGKGFPYVIHVLEAMEIVATMTSDQELLAAAVLHDTVEDTSVTLDCIRREFGKRVADIVEAESDTFPENVSEADSWRARKEAAIKRLSSASADVRMVALGDKLSNMRAIERDYRRKGDEVWSIFHAPGGKADHEWHYRGLADALCTLEGTDAYREFTLLIEKVFGPFKPELVDMGEWVESGGGFMGKSYDHKDGKKMMKLYNPSFPAQDSIREFRRSRAVHALGINTPKALRVVTDGVNTGVEFERIPSKRSFARAISEEPQNLERYAREFARECKKLHSTQCDTTLFQSSKQRYLKATEQIPSLDGEQKERLKSFIAGIPEATTCVHGDLHIGNLITNGEENWFIDLADFGYGNPESDLGMLYVVCNANPDYLTRELYHISNEQALRVWKYFTEEYYGQGCNLGEINGRLSLYGLVSLVYCCRKNGFPPVAMEFVNRMLEKI